MKPSENKTEPSGKQAVSGTASYVVITPLRDEAQFIENTFRSVRGQTITPAQWIMVNDGSTDDTGRIIDDFAADYDWIKALHRNDRGYRKPGAGVVEAFYAGFNILDRDNYDYVVKLDGDLSFEPDFFEQLFKRFDQDPDLGLAGGGVYHLLDGRMVLEKNPIFHVRGATKVYRKKCWDDIGGIEELTGWDTIDEVMANMHGWKTRTFLDLEMLHHRYTGAASGTWKNMAKNGRANYISGYHPLFMVIKVLRRVFKKPYGIESLALAAGYLGALLSGEKRIQNKDFIRYIRQEQLKKITFRKSIWD